MGKMDKGLVALILTGIIAFLLASSGVYLLDKWMYSEPSKPSIVKELKNIEDNAESKDILPVLDQKEDLKPSEDDMAQKVIYDHINSYLLKGYTFNGMTRDDYIQAIAEACVIHSDSVEKALWVASMIQKESSYRISAKPGKATNSSARGFIQVIWRYHGKMLAKNGISKSDLDSDISKSVKAGILVFDYYLRLEKGNFKKALRRYRGLSTSESEQQYYYNYISTVYQKLQKDFKEVKSS